MIRILAFGDSLTAGFGLAAGESFADQLEQALRDLDWDIHVINAGVSGDTSSGGLSRIDFSLRERPHLVILELGANDGLIGFDPEHVRESLAAVIERCRDAGALVLLCGVSIPAEHDQDYPARFERMFTELAARYEVPLFPDFLGDVAGDPGLTLFDGFHPNEGGVRTVVQRILPFVQELLRRVRSGPG
jgi:acyl-CoA thioesterase-1